MFESVVTKLVKTVGRDYFLPSPSLTSSENIHPLSLVERKASRWWFGNNDYYTTEFKFADVVSNPAQDFKVLIEDPKDICSFSKNAVTKIDGKLAAHFKSIFAAELDNVDSITISADLGDLQLTEVNQQSLVTAVKGRQLNMKHEVVREISAKNRRALCVVVGVITTTKPCKITATLNVKVDGDVKSSTPIASLAGGEISGDVDSNTSRVLTLPASTALAYQVLELAVDSQGHMRVMLLKDSPGGFDFAKFDTTDARPPAGPELSDAQLASMFEGICDLASDKRARLLQQVQQLCDNIESIRNLATALYPGNTDTAVKSGEVKAIVDMIASEPDSDKVSTSVRALCRALKNLDELLLSNLAKLTRQEIEAVYEIVQQTSRGNTVPTKSEDLQKLVAMNEGRTLTFVITDLCHTLDSDGLHPCKGDSLILRSVRIALYALKL